MAYKTLTAANSTLTLTASYAGSSVGGGVASAVESLLGVSTQIKGFGTNMAVNLEDVEHGETRMSIDGILYGAWVPNPENLTLTLQPASPSMEYMMALCDAQKIVREVFQFNGVLTCPSIRRRVIITNAYITRQPTGASLGKTMQEVSFHLSCEQLMGAPF